MLRIIITQVQKVVPILFIFLMTESNILNTQTTLGNVYVNINLTKGLEFRSVLGTSIVTRGNNLYEGSTLDQISRAQNGRLNTSNGRESYWSSENYFTYNTEYRRQIMTLDAMVGLSWQETNIFNISNIRRISPLTILNSIILVLVVNKIREDQEEQDFAFNSYFGRSQLYIQRSIPLHSHR